jgi:hypothetical protein
LDEIIPISIVIIAPELDGLEILRLIFFGVAIPKVSEDINPISDSFGI